MTKKCVVPVVPTDPCNTKGSVKSDRRVSPAIHWIFTFNNYEEDDKTKIFQILVPLCKRFVFQEETGENGTPHLQGYVELITKKRGTEIITYTNKIHWEGCNKPENAEAYCMKERTRTGEIYQYPKPIRLILPNKPWQIQLLKQLENEPDDRTVHWIWEPIGGVGKSQFAKYCMGSLNYCYCDGGRKSDIVNLVYNTDMNRCRCIMFDIDRSKKNSISYSAIEQIKNGMVCNTKFETGYKLFNSPHIVIFCNYPPDRERLSSDRWKIYEIVNMELVIWNGDPPCLEQTDFHLDD